MPVPLSYKRRISEKEQEEFLELERIVLKFAHDHDLHPLILVLMLRGIVFDVSKRCLV
jgi:hypothetical protein